MTAKAKQPPIRVVSARKQEEEKTGLKAAIHAAIVRSVQDVIQRIPDSKHNIGRTLATAFVWDEAEKVVKGMSADSWRRIEEFADLNKDRPPGQYGLADSPGFQVMLEVTQPVRRFNDDAMVAALVESKYKIPPHTARELVQQGKPPGKSSRKFSIIERK
jgi:hypothetical protein